MFDFLPLCFLFGNCDAYLSHDTRPILLKYTSLKSVYVTEDRTGEELKTKCNSEVKSILYIAGIDFRKTVRPVRRVRRMACGKMKTIHVFI